MLSLVEREEKKNSGNNSNNSGSPSSPSFTTRPSRTVTALSVVTILTIALYISFFLLPAFSETDDVTDAPRRKQQQKNNKQRKGNNNNPKVPHQKATVEEAKLVVDVPVHEEEQHDKNMEAANDNKNHQHGENSNNDVKKSNNNNNNNNELEPWGYNKNRNVPRWKAIYQSIKSDVDNERASNKNKNSIKKFVLVDYGSDQGFFSISAAHAFKDDGIFVVSVEMGGVGGEIWKKGISAGNDVLSIQERMVEKYVNDNNNNNDHDHHHHFMVCQTKISPKMFFDLVAKNETHRYQFVLSVFHWFDLPTRKAFEQAIVALFKTAKSTFIELPTIGDRSSLIRKQVGWNNFERWYDGRSDIKQIILDAAKNEKFPVKVTKIVSVPWLRWTRDMYRVDWIDEQQDEDHDHHEQHRAENSFHCKTRRDQVYFCSPKREKLQECADIVV